jgi:hypothetical protein
MSSVDADGAVQLTGIAGLVEAVPRHYAIAFPGLGTRVFHVARAGARTAVPCTAVRRVRAGVRPRQTSGGA